MNNCAIDNLTLYTLRVAASLCFISPFSLSPSFLFPSNHPSILAETRKKAVQLPLSAVTKRVESDSNRVPISLPLFLLLSRSFSRMQTTSMIDRP